MTSTIVIDGSYAPQPEAASRRPVRSKVASPLSFGGVLKSERIKLSSLRSIRLTLAITVLMGLGLSALIALAVTTEGSIGGTDAAGLQMYLLMVATFSIPFLALIFGVLGVFAISSEYSSGMILSTLTAVPGRTPVFVAKALSTALLAGATALLLVIGGLGIAVAFNPDSAAELFSTAVLSGVLGTVGYLVLIALLAFGIAGLLRSTAGGIAVIAGVTFVLPIAMQVLMISGWEWVPVVAEYMPASLGNALSQGFTDTTAQATSETWVREDGTPGFWLALVSMAAWVTAAVAPAALLFKRRDAK